MPKHRRTSFATDLLAVGADPVLVAAGIGLVVLAAVDLALTVLHPTLRGPLSYVVTRGTWIATRAVARGTRRHSVLGLAAPAAMAGQFAAWVVTLWVGFALIYLPSVERLAYTPTIDFGDRTLVEALYLSATALTTVGFGDLVAGSDALRMVTVLESASGLAVITGAITYLMSVYPLVSAIHTAAQVAATGGDDGRPARLILRGGSSALTDLHGRLIRVHQDTRRFPILYYFHTDDDTESLLSLLRGSVLVCAHLQWSADPGAVPSAALYGPDLQRTLERIMDDYARRFLGGRRDRPQLAPLDGDDARHRLAQLRARFAEVEPRALTTSEEVPAGFAEFIGRSDAFLDDLSKRHEYAYSRLLTG
jgi:hypothetical protein